MTLMALGLSVEFKSEGIASNCLWPRTAIATAAVKNLLGGDVAVQGSRLDSIMGDAAHAILVRDSKTCTGQFFLDQDVLEEEGVVDFSKYAVNPEAPLLGDFFVDDNPPEWVSLSKL
jgi:citronellol/citronellal dehydrogenase